MPGADESEGCMAGLEERVAIVTGGGEGIGLGIARRFAREGAIVVLAEVNESTGAASAKAISHEFAGTGRFVHTDVTDRDSVEAMVDQTLAEHGRIDVLVNNAWGGGAMVR